MDKNSFVWLVRDIIPKKIKKNKLQHKKIKQLGVWRMHGVHDNPVAGKQPSTSMETRS